MTAALQKWEKTWGMLAHLSMFAGHFIPFGNIIAPLVIWLVKRDESDFVAYHGKESLNFQISVTIYVFISFILALLLVGFLLVAILWIFNLIIVIIAGIKANDGEWYRYPLTIRFIK